MKLRIIICTVLFSGFSNLILAQADKVATDSLKKDRRMKFSGNTKFTLNQSYFENWVAGGENSLTAIFGLDYDFNYKSKRDWFWDTNLMLSVGTTSIGGSTFNKKVDDRFEINSLVGKQINERWSYSFLANFRTQLLPGYQYYTEEKVNKREKISQIFSPAIVRSGLGWRYKNKDEFWINLSPLVVQITLVNGKYTRDLKSGENYFGVQAGKTSKFELGASVSGHHTAKIMKNITLENKLSIYVNYLENTKDVDVNWNADLRLKVNDWISGSFTLQLIYDKDLSDKLQLRELLGMGLNVDL